MMYYKLDTIAWNCPSSGKWFWRSCSMIFTVLSAVKFSLTFFSIVWDTSITTASSLSLCDLRVLRSLIRRPSTVPRSKIRFAVLGIWSKRTDSPSFLWGTSIYLSRYLATCISDIHSFCDPISFTVVLLSGYLIPLCFVLMCDEFHI